MTKICEICGHKKSEHFISSSLNHDMGRDSLDECKTCHTQNSSFGIDYYHTFQEKVKTIAI